MKKCPKCNTENEDNSKFCINCGADLSSITEVVPKDDKTEVITDDATKTIEISAKETETNVSDIFKNSGICPNCFSLIDDKEAKRCPFCGFNFVEGKEEPPSTFEKGKSKKVFLVVIIVIISSIFVLGLFTLLITRKSNEPSNTVESRVSAIKKAKKVSDKTKKLIKDGNLYEKLKEYDQAIICWEKISKNDPGNLEASIHLSKLFFLKGEYDKSLNFIKKVLERTNNDPEIFFIKSKIEIKKRQYDEAEKDLKSAIALSPENKKYLFDLSNLYMSLGKYEEAYEILKKLNEMDPDQEEVLRNLVKCSKILKDENGTKKYTATFEEKFPEENKKLEISKKFSSENIKPEENEGENSLLPKKNKTVSQNITTEEKKNLPTENHFISVTVNTQAVAISGETCSVEITLGSQNFHASCSNLLTIDNLKPGTFPYNITVRYYNLSTGDLEETYSGSGFIDIRYNNQNLYVKIIGGKVILE